MAGTLPGALSLGRGWLRVLLWSVHATGRNVRRLADRHLLAVSPDRLRKCSSNERVNVGEARGGPAEGKANEVHLMKKMSQIRLAVWCKGRIQMLVEVGVKGREAPSSFIGLCPGGLCPVSRTSSPGKSFPVSRKVAPGK